MKAIVAEKYGSPDVLKMKELDRPQPGPGQVLVRVAAASTHPGDWHILRADPFFLRIGYGLLRPKMKVLGSDIAGEVEAVGAGVERFKPGDAVFGDVSKSGWGGFAEYVVASEADLVLKPESLSFEEAAAIPTSAITALQGLRDHGRLEAGQKVLVNGASGGVGTFAVQIAKSLGAEVTAVCSTRNVEMVRDLGADHVIDYTKEDFTKGEQRYDLIFDTAAYRSITDYKSALAAGGTYLLVGGSTMRFVQVALLGLIISMTGSRRFGTFVAKPNAGDLGVVKELVESGKVKPVIDRRYSLSEVPDAIRYLEEGHPRGKVVIAV